MPRQICSHPNATVNGGRCPACGVIVAVSTQAVPPRGEYPGAPAAHGTAVDAVKAGNVSAIDNPTTA